MSRDDYIEVSERLQTFYKQHPDGSLQSEYEITEVLGQCVIVVKALAYRTPDDPRPGVGHAWELVPGRTPFTKGSELMVGETSAWGRALAALGIAVHRGIASAQEVRAAQGRQSTRIKTTPEDDPFYAQGPTDADAPAETLERLTPSVESQLDPRYKAVTPKQLGMIHAIMGKWQVEPVQKVAVLNELLTANGMRRILDTTKDLSIGEASYLITKLKEREAMQEPP